MAAYDVMPDIELYQPASVEDATELAARLKGKAWLLAGGQDTYGWLKDRAKTVEAMIDLKGIDALKGIREIPGGVEIGALTTLTEIVQNPLIGQRYPLLREAAAVVASPQIRNMGTLGGNLCQDTRCWYYRRGLSCYRAGGNICYADSPAGMNRGARPVRRQPLRGRLPIGYRHRPERPGGDHDRHQPTRQPRNPGGRFLSSAPTWTSST